MNEDEKIQLLKDWGIERSILVKQIRVLTERISQLNSELDDMRTALKEALNELSEIHQRTKDDYKYGNKYEYE